MAWESPPPLQRKAALRKNYSPISLYIPAWTKNTHQITRDHYGLLTVECRFRLTRCATSESYADHTVWRGQRAVVQRHHPPKHRAQSSEIISCVYGWPRLDSQHHSCIYSIGRRSHTLYIQNDVEEAKGRFRYRYANMKYIWLILNIQTLPTCSGRIMDWQRRRLGVPWPTSIKSRSIAVL